MPERIKKLQIKNLRGIVKRDIPIDGKSIVILGENGTGKSSIVDALEFFFTGTIAHLDGVQGLSVQRHATHVNADPSDVEVTVSFDPGDVVLSRTFSNEPRPPQQLQPYFREVQQGVSILRRTKILTFITSQPADRFRAIGSIIGIEALDEMELSLHRLRDDLKAASESKADRIGLICADLSETTGSVVQHSNAALTSLQQYLEAQGLRKVASFEDAEVLSEELLYNVRREGATGVIQALNELKGLRVASTDLQSIRQRLSEIDEHLEQLQAENAAERLKVLQLLEIGRHVIDSFTMNRCPLCEQPIEKNAALSSIGNRIDNLTALSQRASDVRQLVTKLSEELQAVFSELRSAASALGLVPELEPYKTQLNHQELLLSSLSSQCAVLSDLTSRVRLQHVSGVLDSLDVLIGQVSKSAAELLESSALSAEDKRILETDRVIQKAKSIYKSLLALERERDALNQRYKVAEELYSVFTVTKNDKIQSVYNSMESDIRSYYSHLHPEALHKNISLAVVAGRRASTTLKLESFGKPNEDPRAFCSEGHLDSLGLCIFLSFVKRFNEHSSLVVLDDVLTTIDSQHRGRVCSLLLEHFSDRQLIVTTHDEIWFQQLRAAQSSHDLVNDFMNWTIVRWGLDEGPVLYPFKTNWQTIQERISDGNKREVGNLGRQYLEWVLFEICNLTRAKLSIPQSRTLQFEVKELFDSVKSRMSALLGTEQYEQTYGGVIAELEATTPMGNLLSHNNIIAANISVEEAKSFCDAIRRLHLLFTCNACEKMLKYNQGAKRIECVNPRCNSPHMIKTR
ncbi:MAG: AAA family ATPase [Planctomycetota bacterium]|jgi:LSD1 subclass zinc finger protein